MGPSVPTRNEACPLLVMIENTQAITTVLNVDIITDNRNNFRSNTKRELKMLRLSYEKLQREHNFMYDIFMNDLEFRNRLRNNERTSQTTLLQDNYNTNLNLTYGNRTDQQSSYRNMSYHYNNNYSQPGTGFVYSQQQGPHYQHSFSNTPNALQSTTQGSDYNYNTTSQGVHSNDSRSNVASTTTRNNDPSSSSRQPSSDNNSKSFGRNPQSFLTHAELNHTPIYGNLYVIILGLILILLITLEAICANVICTIILRSLGVGISLWSFHLYSEKNRARELTCTKGEKELVDRIRMIINKRDVEGAVKVKEEVKEEVKEDAGMDRSATRIDTITYKQRIATFYIDSGSNYHIVNDESLLEDIVKPSIFASMGVISGMSKRQEGEKIMGYGTINPLGKVLFAPDVARNFISVNQLTKSGWSLNFLGHHCTAIKEVDGKILLIYGQKCGEEQYMADIKVRDLDSFVDVRTQTMQEANDWAINGLCYMITARLGKQSNESIPVSKRPEILTDPLSICNELIIDSGCSEHMFDTCRSLTSYSSFNFGEKYVTVANGSVVPVEGKGQCGILKKVYFVPLLSHCLLSVNSLTYDGIDVLFSDDYAIITRGNSGLQFDSLKARKINGLYRLPLM